MTQETLKKMYQLLLTEPHAPTVCAKLEAIAREALAQPEQEPVCPDCKAVVLYECVACSSNNYPPQRKPLTHKEIWNAIRPLTQSDAVCMSLVQISMDEYRAIEAAHGIKGNT